MKSILLVVLGAIHGLFVHKHLGYPIDDFHFWFYTVIGSAIIFMVVEEIDEHLNKPK